MSKIQLVIIIPASNEEAHIRDCLQSVANQRCDSSFLVIVSANACTDGTANQVKLCKNLLARKQHELVLLESSLPGKVPAINRAEAAIPSNLRALPRLFLDADVRCSPALFEQLIVALETPEPRFVTGKIVVTKAKSPFTRAYARVWCQLPFVRDGVTGAGLFSVNAAGRERWGKFPHIVSDDTFVRLNFTPNERIEVSEHYYWPMVEGISALIRVRRRQDKGVREVYELYPHLFENEAKSSMKRMELLKLALNAPFGVTAYFLVHVVTRLGRSSEDWARGR